jgi:hypothetical protein
MRLDRAIRVHVLALLVVGAGVGTAHGQIRFLPNSEYEPVNIRPPQAIVSRVDALRRNDEFERLSAFKGDSRYRMAARPIGRLKTRVRDQGGRNGTALCTGSLI